MTKMNPDRHLVSADSDRRPEVGSVVRHLLRHPLRSFVARWNWKAGLLSVLLRTPVYVAATFRHGWEAATLAGAVEAIFSAGAAGVCAAFTEAVRYAVPEFAVATLLLVILPVLILALDAALHYLMHTPNLATGVATSLVVSILSSAFNWYSMRRGTLLVGPTARSFTSDMTSLPLLIARFVSAPFVAAWRSLRFQCPPTVEG
jgi:hypothetical protein